MIHRGFITEGLGENTHTTRINNAGLNHSVSIKYILHMFLVKRKRRTWFDSLVIVR